MSSYNDRQQFELDRWPELRKTVNDLVTLVLKDKELSRPFKNEIFTIASTASGCLHCQSHGAYFLHLDGVDTKRIQDLWNYERSDLFTDAERAAFDLVRAAAQSPNATEPEHFEELRKHYSDTEIMEILAVNCLAGWLNRWNDTIATVTDQESVDWAEANLKEVGWHAGKHKGEAKEQRKGHPASVGWVKER